MMFKTKQFAVCFILIVASAFPTGASANPTSVAHEFFEFLQSEDYVSAARLFDPEELKGFRALLSFIYESADESNQELTRALFGTNATAQSVAGLSDAEFLASILALTMGEIKKSMPIGFSGVEMLGYVSEGSDIAHVVTRFNVDMSDGGVSMIDVVSLNLVDDEWRILMQADMKAMANQLRATYGNAD